MSNPQLNFDSKFFPFCAFSMSMFYGTQDRFLQTDVPARRRGFPPSDYSKFGFIVY